MTTKISTLSLDQFFIKKLNIDWTQEDKPGSDSEHIDMAFNYNVGQKKDEENHFRLLLIVKFSPSEGESGITGEVQIEGFFSFPEATKEEEMQYLVRVNGCSILYGLLRGQLALISGSFPRGKFMLPAVVMNDVVNDIEEKKANEAKK